MVVVVVVVVVVVLVASIQHRNYPGINKSHKFTWLAVGGNPAGLKVTYKKHYELSHIIKFLYNKTSIIRITLPSQTTLKIDEMATSQFQKRL